MAKTSIQEEENALLVMVVFGCVWGVSRVSESQEIFFRAADDDSSPKRIPPNGKAGIEFSLLRNKKLLRE